MSASTQSDTVTHYVSRSPYASVSKEPKPKLPRIKFGKLKNYEIHFDRHIGHGGTGEVYAGVDLKANRKVAIKVLKATSVDNKYGVRKLKMEYYALTKVRHGPNIVELLDVLEDEQDGMVSHLFVFERVNKVDLHKSSHFKRLSEDERRDYLHKALVALEYTHSKGLLHGDFKAKNVLRTRSGEVRLIDFGFTRPYTPDKPIYVFPGTARWKAPELILQYPWYDFAVDMWAFGCLCYLCVFLDHPWSSVSNPFVQLEKITEVLGTAGLREFVEKYDVDSEYVESLPETMPRDLDATYRKIRPPSSGVDLVGKLLAYDPAQRLTATEALEHPFFNETTSSYYTTETTESE